LLSEGAVRISRPVLLYKLKAAAASLSVFLLFATVLTVISYRFWYPDYLFWTDGGIQGLCLIFAVDFVLGPVLSVVFFHPEKSRRKLIFDIVVVVTVQLSAMIWGAWQVHSQRPIAVVYGNQRFISVAPQIMALQMKSPEDMQAFSEVYPPFVYRRPPATEEEKRRATYMLFQMGFHHESQAWLFQPYLPNLQHVFERQGGIHRYVRERLGAQWEAWVRAREQTAMTDYRFAFYEGRYENAVLVFSKTGDYLHYLGMGTTPIPYVKPEPVSP
jgi:hypothetical protein